MRYIAMLAIFHYCSPCGTLLLGECDGHLCVCDWPTAEGAIRASVLRRLGQPESVFARTPLLDCAAMQLDEYFAGTRTVFDLPVAMHGTEFQRRVWTALCSTAYGSTETYAGLARRCGCPMSVRAVANAVAANAMSIIIPCHRIVAAGSTGGYAGGAEAKRQLLALEARHSLIHLPN